MTKNELKKIERKMDYKGCRNCKNQIEPLRMCEWAERGGDGHLHFICPMWEHKNAEMNKCKVRYFEPTEYEKEIYKMTCRYMAMTEERDRTLSDRRSKYDDTETIFTNPYAEKISRMYACDLLNDIDPNHIYRKDIREEIKRHPDYTAQRWIDEWHRILEEDTLKKEAEHEQNRDD